MGIKEEEGVEEGAPIGGGCGPSSWRICHEFCPSSRTGSVRETARGRRGSNATSLPLCAALGCHSLYFCTSKVVTLCTFVLGNLVSETANGRRGSNATERREKRREKKEERREKREERREKRVAKRQASC